MDSRKEPCAREETVKGNFSAEAVSRSLNHLTRLIVAKNTRQRFSSLWGEKSSDLCRFLTASTAFSSLTYSARELFQFSKPIYVSDSRIGSVLFKHFIKRVFGPQISILGSERAVTFYFPLLGAFFLCSPIWLCGRPLRIVLLPSHPEAIAFEMSSKRFITIGRRGGRPATRKVQHVSARPTVINFCRSPFYKNKHARARKRSRNRFLPFEVFPSHAARMC